MSKRTDELIAQCSNPDKLPEALLGLQEEIRAIEATAQANASKVPELEEQVKNLRDTNMKLFLRQTQETHQDPPEETPEQIFDRLFRKQVLPEQD